MEYKPATIRMLSRLGPSGALGMALAELGEEREEILALSADMSDPSGLGKFRGKFPERHYNFGIAEQNAVSAAVGMALEGFVPFVTTYATFFAMRAADQIKMGLGYMRANVKLVGILGGLSAGLFGPTHLSIEDFACMRAIPNLTVLSPADGLEILKCVRAAAELDGPVYIRLTGEAGMPGVHFEEYDFAIGKPVQLLEGERVAIFATGAVCAQAVAAAKMVEEACGFCVSVFDVHTLKPLDMQTVWPAAQKAELLVSVEEHNVCGGLGSVLSEGLSQKGGMPPLLRLGVNDVYPHAGSYAYLLHGCGLDAESIAHSIQNRLKGELH